MFDQTTIICKGPRAPQCILDPVTCAPAAATLDWFLCFTGGTTGEINPRLVEVNAGLVVVMRITSTHSLFSINHVDIFFFFSLFFFNSPLERQQVTQTKPYMGIDAAQKRDYI